MSDLNGLLLRRKMLYRQVVGKRVRLRRAIRTNAGRWFHKDELLLVEGTYREKFELCRPAKPKERITRVSAAYFELTPEQTCGACDRYEPWKRTRKRGRCGYFPKSVRAEHDASECFMFRRSMEDTATA